MNARDWDLALGYPSEWDWTNDLDMYWCNGHADMKGVGGMDEIVIGYVQKGLEENALLKLKELFGTSRVVMVNAQPCPGDTEGNSYTLFNIKFAHNGKAVIK